MFILTLIPGVQRPTKRLTAAHDRFSVNVLLDLNSHSVTAQNTCWEDSVRS